ncbi:MAG: DUF86 domain-containing protein [Acidipropionibacterium sp.]|jgi:uncharacterized protein with HEPN domain|nr:DUF86 domain-containing protein [Acidipropionibacterium sp.]
MSRSSVETLRDALTHFRLMLTYAQRNLDDQLVIDAVCMRLSAGIEALATLDPSVRDMIFGDDWPLMWGMRNRIAHGYLLVDSSIIRQTLIIDIPSLMARIEKALEHGSTRGSCGCQSCGDMGRGDRPG